MNNIIKTIGQKIYSLIRPLSADEDRARREKILNILLGLSITVFVILNIIRLIDVLSRPDDRGLPLAITLLILIFFIFLFFLSRRGYLKTASWLLIATYALPMFYSSIAWGADLPAAIILGVLVITLAGVLIGSQLVFWATAALSLFLIILTYLQNTNLITVANYWRAEKHELADAIVYALLFLMIAAVAQLFCRALEKALRRARQSEQELRQERDLLEIRVAQKSEELRRANAEKINQLYRLAEFGRLSSGVFHDLINPLTAVSLNLEQVKNSPVDKLTTAKSYLHQATLAASKMEGLIAGIRKQIAVEPTSHYFSSKDEIKEILEILAYKARRAGVKMEFSSPENFRLYGSPLKFSQIIMNLLSNAIEASSSGQTVKILSYKTAVHLLITIEDEGEGIAEKNLLKIFQPFFSTKNQAERIIKNTGGLGLGLSSVKHIIEHDFKGKISVSSQIGRGSKFTLTLPMSNLQNSAAKTERISSKTHD